MPDALLTPQDQEEELSKVYVRAIAAACGYVTSQPDYDRDSIDIRFSAGGGMRPAIDAQLKASIALRRCNDVFRFSIKRKNYNDLRLPTQTPRIVIVFHLPRTQASWVDISPSRLILRKCAYWASLLGMPELDGSQNSVTISIPVVNCFNVGTLKLLMDRARAGTIL